MSVGSVQCSDDRARCHQLKASNVVGNRSGGVGVILVEWYYCAENMGRFKRGNGVGCVVDVDGGGAERRSEVGVDSVRAGETARPRMRRGAGRRSVSEELQVQVGI
jgi:hypothetical protein